MKPVAQERFARFAQQFVRAYWETVKRGEFNMPTNEPVEESVEELLAAISHETSVEPPIGKGRSLYRLRMEGAYGNWWLFGFHDLMKTWALVAASVRSDKDASPHDLLEGFYSAYFGPFLRRVTELANARGTR